MVENVQSLKSKCQHMQLTKKDLHATSCNPEIIHGTEHQFTEKMFAMKHILCICNILTALCALELTVRKLHNEWIALSNCYISSDSLIWR
jgi:hypothetical protein